MYLRAVGRRFTQMNTYFLVVNSKRCTEQFNLHTTDTHKRKRIIRRTKFYKKDLSIDIWTQYTIFLITSRFFFWLRGFLTFAVSTTSSSHSFVFWNRYPFSLPVRFQLLNLAVFCWFLSFCSDSAATNNVCLCFCQKVPRFSLAIMLWSLSSQGCRGIRISSKLPDNFFRSGIINLLFDGLAYNTSGNFAHCLLRNSQNISTYYMLNHRIRCIYWTSTFWSIDSCQNREPADQYYLTVSRTQVSTHRSQLLFWSYPLTSY